MTRERKTNHIYLWWFIRFITINLKPEYSGHSFIFWSCKTEFLYLSCISHWNWGPVICGLGYSREIGGVTEGQSWESCLSARRVASSSHCMGNADRDECAYVTALLASGIWQSIVRMSNTNNSREADIFNVFFLSPTFVPITEYISKMKQNVMSFIH